MASIAEIADKESGLSVRTKLNAAITEANKVDSKADASGLALVATSGAYSDLSGLPTLGSMAAESATDYTPKSGLGSAAFTASSDYATTAQGGLADSAVQPGDATAVPYVAVTASKTFALTDANTEQQVSAAAVLTIDTEASVAFARGDKLSVLSLTADAVSVTASTGVTINGVDAGSATLTGQYSGAVITKIGADAWVIAGDIGDVL